MEGITISKWMFVEEYQSVHDHIDDLSNGIV